jgi:hypothetical protein
MAFYFFVRISPFTPLRGRISFSVPFKRAGIYRIVQVSSHPQNALVFLDGVLRGETDSVFRGYPLGNTRIRLQKSGFQDFSVSTFVTGELIVNLRKVFLVPRIPERHITHIGNEDAVIWDPERRGIVVVLPGLRSVKFIDILRETESVREFPQTPQKIAFDADGTLYIEFPRGPSWIGNPFGTRIFASFDSLLTEGLLSPEKDRLVFFQGNNVLIKNLSSQKVTTVTTEQVPVRGVWWMGQSDDILIATIKGLFLYNTAVDVKRQILKVDTFDTPVFIPDKERLFYKTGKTWESITIGL